MRLRARRPVLALVALAPWGPACPSGAQQHAEPAPLDQRWDLARPAGRVELPSAVAEASGLAFNADGSRLLVHGDERAIVVAVDPATGAEAGRFAVGRPAVAADLEGIVTVGERLFLVASNGLLYESREAADGATAPYRLTDTRLGDGCEVEGLEHDPHDDVLLLACKTVAPPGPHALVHRLPLDPSRGVLPPVRIPLAELEAFGVRPRLHPSAVALSPGGSSLLLLAARERLLVEVAREGRILSVVELRGSRHPQPEGLAVGADGALWVADEARGRDGPMLTWYAPREAR